MGFNLEVGGYFSIKRNVVSIDGNTFIRQDQLVAYCKALLEVFRCALEPQISWNRITLQLRHHIAILPGLACYLSWLCKLDFSPR